MKKKTMAMLIISALFSFALCACGVSEEDYGKVVSERDDLQAKYDTINSDYDTLKAKYDKLEREHNELVDNTSDWLKMTEDEKSAQLARAETERIAAEEEAKKPKEEQAAAEEAARKAEEEKNAGRGIVEKPDESGVIDYPVGPLELYWYSKLLELESFKITEIEESIANGYKITYELIGTSSELIGTSSSGTIGVLLNCYDTDGFLLETVTHSLKVTANERFKVTDHGFIPAETVRIEFASR